MKYFSFFILNFIIAPFVGGEENEMHYLRSYSERAKRGETSEEEDKYVDDLIEKVYDITLPKDKEERQKQRLKFLKDMIPHGYEDDDNLMDDKKQVDYDKSRTPPYNSPETKKTVIFEGEHYQLASECKFVSTSRLETLMQQKGTVDFHRNIIRCPAYLEHEIVVPAVCPGNGVWSDQNSSNKNNSYVEYLVCLPKIMQDLKTLNGGVIDAQTILMSAGTTHRIPTACQTDVRWVLIQAYRLGIGFDPSAKTLTCPTAFSPYVDRGIIIDCYDDKAQPLHYVCLKPIITTSSEFSQSIKSTPAAVLGSADSVKFKWTNLWINTLMTFVIGVVVGFLIAAMTVGRKRSPESASPPRGNFDAGQLHRTTLGKPMSTGTGPTP